MNIIIDVNHPGHVHLFKNFAFQAKKNGWNVLFTAKDKEVTIELLKAYNLDYKNFGKHYNGKLGKIYSLFKHILALFIVSVKFKNQIFLSHGSVPASWVSFILRKKYIAFEDTGNMEQIRLYKPFAHAILTTENFRQNYGKIHVRYRGFHEIAYLHPKYFTPNPEIYNLLNISKEDKFFILRFIAWGASHDVGLKGISNQLKREIILLLLNHGKVFITSEAELPDDLLKYKIKIPPEKIHDALAFADMFIGEGATMASECAVLGTPAVYVNSMLAETIDEQENYGLLFHFINNEGVIEKIEELLNTENLKEKWQTKSIKMIDDKIDVTAFTLWFVENFPESLKIMKQNPNYQDIFK
ncbi:MAG: DUF354 domain-containing protein [Bacteroidales bacterium]|nr:DUF354 domain-containing protein [Bacteroidales bacterium]MBN2758478.1 DUF354 domain-containing protein [Bacteroidales bacterium]